MKFRKRPVVIEARLWDGDWESIPGLQAWAHAGMPPEANSIIRHDGWHLTIRTLEGVMRADAGDWIIRGVKGEFYPCKPDIFAATYEPADEPPHD